MGGGVVQITRGIRTTEGKLRGIGKLEEIITQCYSNIP